MKRPSRQSSCHLWINPTPLTRVAWVLIAIVILGGCTGISRTSVFPPRKSDLLAINQEANGRAYEVLGVIQVDGKNFVAERTLIKRLREKARELGADALLRIRVLSLPRGNGFLRYHLLTAEGIAVRWKSQPVRSNEQRTSEEFAGLAQ
ncbi:MAG: hypothetical protein ACE5JS_19500 [Nitrospinota bacterium]